MKVPQKQGGFTGETICVTSAQKVFNQGMRHNRALKQHFQSPLMKAKDLFTSNRRKAKIHLTTYWQGWNVWGEISLPPHMMLHFPGGWLSSLEESKNHRIRHTSTPQDMGFNSQAVWRWDYSLWGGFASENGRLWGPVLRTLLGQRLLLRAQGWLLMKVFLLG